MSIIDPGQALSTIDSFISVAKELAQFKASQEPQYENAVKDLIEICQKLLTANENLTRWLNKFLLFNFRDPAAYGNFLNLVAEYQTAKNSAEFRQFKFSCADIGIVYSRDIDSKLNGWFPNKQKEEQARQIFGRLISVDAGMVAFVYDYVVKNLDDIVKQMEMAVTTSTLDKAETIRLRAKTDMRPVTEKLEKFSNDLADVMLKFSTLAKVPLTLGSR
jgi:hypothetical protein